MQFFYIKQVDNKKESIFSIKVPAIKMEVSVVAKNEELFSSHIFLSPEKTIQSIAQYIKNEFDGTLEVRAFNPDSVLGKKMVTTKIIGTNNLYGNSPVKTNKISDVTIEDKNAELTAVHIGGFGNDIEHAVVSSSVFAKAVFDIQKMGITLKIDTYADLCDPIAVSIQKLSFPGSILSPMPISLHVLNLYDIAFIADHSLVLDIATKDNNSLHDAYSKIYGIEYHGLNTVNVLTVDTLEEYTVNATIDELCGDKKTLFIPELGSNKSNLNALENISREFPEYDILTHFTTPLKTDIKHFDLTELISENFPNMCCVFKRVDMIVTSPMFTVDVANSFSTPCILLTGPDFSLCKYRYYKQVQIISADHNNYAYDDPDALLSFSRLCQSMRSHMEYNENKKVTVEKKPENRPSKIQFISNKFLATEMLFVTTAFLGFIYFVFS